jgi:hypothetical protein
MAYPRGFMSPKEREPTQTTEQGREIPVPRKPSKKKRREHTEGQAARQRARDRSGEHDY